MKDSVFNALPVVDNITTALALSAGTLFLFSDGTPGVNSQQNIEFFELERPDGNRITYFRRIEVDSDRGTSHGALGYIRIFDILECDPLGVYGEICGQNYAAYTLGDDNLGDKVGSSPEFVQPPPSASQCVC